MGTDAGQVGSRRCGFPPSRGNAAEDFRRECGADDGDPLGDPLVEALAHGPWRARHPLPLSG
ncbi:hypothetical protein GCM10018775_33030 [Streptomyces umbrinus]|nr:hypothetical protein GCM10018775_33030 [Streptomyces umbrinus]